MTKSAFYGLSVSTLALLASVGSLSTASAQTIATASGTAALASALAQAAPTGSTAPEQIPAAQPAGPPPPAAEIVVTGSRIPRTGLTSTSPVATTTAEDIKLQEALSVEDFSTKLPQLAGGVRDTAQGSDSFGATVFDLRNLGQSRTLVLIDGTRAVPFSFRNSVDVSSIPASLIKQVDVLTGGAAAVYGADAVAGVVNFILNDNFNGVQISATDRTAQAGGSEYGGSLTVGGPINDRGHVEFAFDYTQRDEVDADSRSWAATPNATVAPVGGNFTDVASGRKFSFDSNGLFTTTPQTSNFSSEYPLVEPLKRYNLAAFFNYKLTDRIELYGRGMYTNSQSVESGTAGPNPIAVNQVVGISQTNPYLTPQIANELTFVNGVAQVNINKTLGELGLIDYHTERDTAQYQLGLRGPLTSNIKWNDYVQYGRVTEVSPITGDGLVTNATGQNNFALLANSVNLFGPTSTGLSSLGSTLQGNNRTRDQFVTAGTISGTSADIYSLPAGPVGFSIGYEYRRETATITQDTALLDGDTYREGSLAAYSGAVTTKELYAETLVPILKDMFLAKQLDIGYAFRYSDYSLFGSHNTSKFEFNYAPTSDIHFRGSIQRVIRAPNFGEFAATESSLPYYDLITVARLTPRYAGDPCVLGTGNAAQCARFGAPAVGSVNSLSPSYLEGNYYYGGNAAIQPEKGITKTFGMVLTPSSLKRFSATIDYYEVNLYGAIGVIQPVNDLTSCYITNPVANNPLCALAPRDPTNGHLENAYVNNQNLGRIDQQGIDIGVSYSVPVPAWLPGDIFRFNYQGNVVTRYTIQSNPTVAAIDCKGTFGATCSSDATTLVQPDYRHNANVSWVFARAQVQLNWQRIGGVRDSAPGTSDKIPDQDYYDINASYKIRPWLTADVGIHNLLDKDPPFVKGSATFNTFPDSYDVMGRTFAISLTAKY